MPTSALAAAVMLAAALQAEAGELEGRWEGTAAVGDRLVPLAVDLAPSADGRGWTGSLVLSGFGIKGAPLSDVAVVPPRVSFSLASPQGAQGLNARFEVRLEAPGRMAGTLSRAGRESPIALRRTGAAQVDLPLANTALASRAVGEWRGEYELFRIPRRVTLRLDNREGMGRASFVIVGRRHNDLPVDLVRQEGDNVFVVSDASGIRFEGRLSPDGDELRGLLLQGPLEIPLVLHRAPPGSPGSTDGASS